MKALGHHIVAELSQCDPEILTDLDRVQAAMVQAALVARAEIRELAFHRFYPTGVSGVVVLAESHLAIHTWPDLGYAAIDVYTCGDTAEPWRACRYLAEQFGSASMQTTVMERGIPSPNGDFGHRLTAKELREEMFAVSSA